eukprot:XP_014775931.1 PREDICTED: FMRFamide-related neuropeptides-like isoform X2 [Octopus bimaculoides]
MSGLSPFSLLIFIFIYCLTVYAATAMSLAQACMESPSMCESISLSHLSSEEGLKSKRFLRPGRALSGDAFLRFGKNGLNLPFEDKRFLRFGRTDRQFEDMLKEVLQRAENVDNRQKRSTDNIPQSSVQDDSSKITKRNADASDNGMDKRFMKFGKSGDKKVNRLKKSNDQLPMIRMRRSVDDKKVDRLKTSNDRLPVITMGRSVGDKKVNGLKTSNDQLPVITMGRSVGDKKVKNAIRQGPTGYPYLRIGRSDE